MGKEQRSQAVNAFVLVLMSGGIDSTACARFYKQIGFRVEGLFVDFGQAAARKERQAIGKIGPALSIPIAKVRLTNQKARGSGEIAGRNAFLLYTALMCFREPSGVIAMGIHSGTSYYDCTADFAQHMERVLDGYAAGKISFGTPFLAWNKLDVWRYFQRMHLPAEITYSCELGLAQPCGQCGSCRDLEGLYARKND